MHIISTILERCLIIIDDASQSVVEAHLHTVYSAMSFPRVAQRQIKLLFYEGLRLRVLGVLKAWEGLLFRSRSKGHGWQISFCVFLIIALVLDKIIGDSFYFCEGRIAYYGYEPIEER